MEVFVVVMSIRGWDVARLVRASDRHAAEAGSIPRCGKGFFFPKSTFSADFLKASVHSRVQSHALTSVGTSKILQSMLEFGGLWKL